MKLPKLTAPSSSTTFVEEFKGYNHNLRSDMVDSYGRMEFYDMQNMCSDDYPVISTRPGITKDTSVYGTVLGIHNHTPDSGLVVTTHGLTILRNGIELSASNPEDIKFNNEPKEFATIGAYTFIAPDRYVYDATSETDTQGGTLYPANGLHFSYPTRKSGSSVVAYIAANIVPCDINGEALDYVAQASAPSDTTKYWYDTENKKWKKYSTTYTEWVEIESSYSRVKFMAYDGTGTTPTGYTELDEYRTKIFNVFLERHVAYDTIGLFFDESAWSYQGDRTDMLIYTVGVDDQSGIDAPWIVISTGDELYSNIWYYFWAEDYVPPIDHISSLSNRVWGCSNYYHELYASKQGNPFQWHNYAGISSDSYALSLGSAEEITCVTAYNNYPTFFTETKMMKIYGSYPSAYQLYTVDCDGVRSGCAKTAVTVEGTLYYVSNVGVMAYSGSVPASLTDKFGAFALEGKTLYAGKDGEKYCLSIADSDAALTGDIFEYDTRYGFWYHKIADRFIGAALRDGFLSYINKADEIVNTTPHDQTKDYLDTYSLLSFDLSRRRIQSTSYGEHMLPVDESHFGNNVNEKGRICADEYTLAERTSEGLLGVTVSDEDYNYKTTVSGAAYPVKVTAGKTYIVRWYASSSDAIVRISYFHIEGSASNPTLYSYLGTQDFENIFEWVDGSGTYTYIVDSDGNRIVFDKHNNFGEYLYATKITIPDTANYIFINFGSKGDYQSTVYYQDVSLHEYEGTTQESIPWMLETGWQGLSTPYQKYFSRIQFRLDFCGSLMCQVKYAETDEWQTVLNIEDPETDEDTFKSMTIPVNVRRTDRIKIRLSGSGWIKLYSVGYVTQEGSERCLI